MACTSSQLDLGDRASVAQAITGTQPDVVGNAGAWTAVDDCESDPDRAWRINALGVRWVADAARCRSAEPGVRAPPALIG